MKGVKELVLIFLLIGCGYVPLQAQAASASGQDPPMLETVVVTASQEETPFRTGDVDLEQTPAFVSVIGRDAFEGRMEGLAEVIEKETGIQVRQAGGLGSFSSVSLRGASSEQVMIFLDGVLLNDASGGGVDLSDISLSDVEAIEIYRGVTPISFGKASIGGAINIKTRRARKGLNAGGTAGYGSFDTRKLAAFIHHKPNRIDYLISADYLSSENDFRFLNNRGTKFNPADDRIERRNNAWFNQHNVLSRLGLEPSETVRIDFTNQWFSKDQGLPSLNNSELTRTSLDTGRNISTLSLVMDDLGPYHLNTITRLDYTWKEEEFDDRLGQVGLGRQRTIFTSRRYGAHFFLEWPARWHVLGFMLDVRRETYGTEDLLRVRNPGDSTRDTVCAGLQDSLLFFRERLIVTPALRYARFQDELRSAVNLFGVPLQGRSESESYASPQVGVKYRPFDGLALKSNLAGYVREPSFFELFGDRGFFLGNEELKAERGLNFDMGFELTWPFWLNWLRQVSIRAAYFRSNVDDLITRVFDARGVGKSENVSGARIDGLESEIGVCFLEHFRLAAKATVQDAKNLSDAPAFRGKRLPGRFETSYLARLEARFAGFRIYSEYVTEDGIFYDTANLLKAAQKREINAGISWLADPVQIDFEAKNLGGDQVEDFNGFPLPGRSFFVSVKYRF